ncbi:flagellar hook-length control protein FliK [Pseudocitrobacter corydidari]|uniref:Flagellar hook-length control protein n=1 Tax=Pseudocitrobacter corydidari TaxID=2891570 RepID=A0ABY3RZZ0_9ENTR|nr:flagellar hook-length control protein FliK [Pseudocitrobacter corydidari]UGS40010.1 Flagellar hook-length control protein [Pseudocitrobacter corydidari]
MINLLTLLAPDVDSGTPGISTQAGGEADFLSLLSDALGSENSKPLKSLTAALSQEEDDKTPAKTSVTEWLLQQETAQTTVELPDGATTDTQTLLSQLASHLKSDVQNAKPQEDSDDDETVSDASLTGMSALMAMLPAVQPAQPTTVTAGTDTPTLNGVSERGGDKSFAQHAASKDIAQPLANSELPAVAQSTPQLTPIALKAEADSTPTAAAPTATFSGLVSVAAQTTPPAPAPIVQAALGSPDWQQSVSQHITLFTRQGQQTAELRLHPEDLGQVHISLKLDDNQAQIQMVSPHSHVRAALEAALPVLRAQLADNGIQLGQSNISSESFAGQQQQQHASGQQSAWRGAASGDDEDEALIAPAALQSAARGDGRVDIFA